MEGTAAVVVAHMRAAAVGSTAAGAAEACARAASVAAVAECDLRVALAVVERDLPEATLAVALVPTVAAAPTGEPQVTPQDVPAA